MVMMIVVLVLVLVVALVGVVGVVYPHTMLKTHTIRVQPIIHPLVTASVLALTLVRALALALVLIHLVATSHLIPSPLSCKPTIYVLSILPPPSPLISL